MDRVLNMIVRLIMRRLMRQGMNKGIDMMAHRGGPMFDKRRANDAVRVVRRAGRL
ncbi:hypothetical protein [Cognatishimia sp.]|uniref:hypothetical protein n=1 Tax=Cognatishimia sp. TaxID=2211648 RepID=UPI00351974C8